MAATAESGMSGARRPPRPPLLHQIPLKMVADVRPVDGPAMIKSENGKLRAYVQLGVRDRDMLGFVEEAQRTVDQKVKPHLPPGMSLAWSGEFENQVRAREDDARRFPRRCPYNLRHSLSDVQRLY